MKRLEVEPRSAEWHAIRAESWTASAAAMLVVKENAELLRDAAAAKGITLDIAPLLKVGLESFYGNTPWTAWAEKQGRIPRFAGNEHTARGQENEERVLAHFEKESMVLIEREVTALSDAHPWLLASFDAVAPQSTDPSVVAPNGFPVEAKCPAFQSRRKLWDAKKTGIGLAIMGLPYYWCQVQHQMLVAEAPYAWFVAAGVEEEEVETPTGKTKVMKVVFPIFEKVPRDDDFLKAYVAIAKFYHETYIEDFEEPPMLPSDQALLKILVEKAQFDKAMAEADHATAVELYFNAKTEADAAKARLEELEAKVLEAAGKMRKGGDEVILLADRLEVKYSTSPGSVTWKSVATQVAKDAGLSEVPPAVIKACTQKDKESIKLKEVV